MGRPRAASRKDEVLERRQLLGEPVDDFLERGHVPFLDPRHEGGYGRVALYAVVLAVAMGLLSVGVNAIGRRRGGVLGGRHRVTSLS